MVTVSARDDVHDSRDDCPATMVAGSAVMSTEGGWWTTTVTESVADPHGPVAVMV